MRPVKWLQRERISPQLSSSHAEHGQRCWWWMFKWWKCVISSPSYPMLRDCYRGIDGRGCSALRPSDSCLTKRGSNDIPLKSKTNTHPSEASTQLPAYRGTLALTHTTSLKYVCERLHFTHTVRASPHIYTLSFQSFRWRRCPRASQVGLIPCWVIHAL